MIFSSLKDARDYVTILVREYDCAGDVWDYDMHAIMSELVRPTIGGYVVETDAEIIHEVIACNDNFVLRIRSLIDDMKQAFADYMSGDDGSGDRSMSTFDADVLYFGDGFDHDLSAGAYQSARSRALHELRRDCV